MGCTEGAAPLPLPLPSAGCEVLHRPPPQGQGRGGLCGHAGVCAHTRVCTRTLGSFVNMGPGMGWWKSRSFQKQVVFLGSSLASGPLPLLTWPLCEEKGLPVLSLPPRKTGATGVRSEGFVLVRSNLSFPRQV